jgi:hypothetical protein
MSRPRTPDGGRYQRPPAYDEDELLPATQGSSTMRLLTNVEDEYSYQ